MQEPNIKEVYISSILLSYSINMIIIVILMMF